MDTVADLERRLARAQAKEAFAKENCTTCAGTGWFEDSTYDRCGVTTRCYTCNGTGLPEARVKEIITAALAPFVKPKPADGTST